MLVYRGVGQVQTITVGEQGGPPYAIPGFGSLPDNAVLCDLVSSEAYGCTPPVGGDLVQGRPVLFALDLFPPRADPTGAIALLNCPPGAGPNPLQYYELALLPN
jgi:hypothetical protein